MAGTGTTSIRSYNFFIEPVVANVTFATSPDVTFVDTLSGTNFISQSIMFSNDGAADIQFSFDGTNLHGRVKGGEALQQDFRRAKRIYLKTTGAPVAIRFWAW